VIDRQEEEDFDYWLDIEMTELNAVKGDLRLRKRLNRLPAIQVLMMAYMNVLK
jgi:cephalosporin-C deacetylase-like acetyl esterase